MAPQTTNIFRQEALLKGRQLSNPEPGEEVVISGISGRYPESNNMQELQENLMDKVNMVTDDERRWKHDNPEVPRHTGKLKAVNKFDAEFFNVPSLEVESMDPACRILMETVYEAIVDAGVRPSELRGQNVGMLVAVCSSETERNWCYDMVEINGFGVTGCCRAFFPNRLSHWLGITGPSFTMDSACSTSLNAIDQAYRYIREGICNSVLVGAANLVLLSKMTLQFNRLGVLSRTGTCSPFDNDANGYVRSEAISAVFLQKAKDAKRIYATVVHAKTNCDGFKPHGIAYPSGAVQKQLLEEFYEECGVDPTTLDFMEAHGTGTKVGDPEELVAIDQVFCQNRKEPLLIGSVRSNLGHPEATSGLCSVSKVIICMETGIIVPNINYKTPREGVDGLIVGRLKVVTEQTPWNGGLVGLNSFGFGGVNSHILLRSPPKSRTDGGRPQDSIPRLVVVSGRTQESVNTVITYVESHPVNAELVRLLHDLHAKDTPRHVYRGYTLLLPGNKKCRTIKSYTAERRPLWFVFPGLDSQWPGMGRSLMKIPAFSAAVDKCANVLKSKGIDVIDLITTDDSQMLQNPLNSFVAIVVVQIGLVDILATIGVVPDGIVGHSLGELVCGYVDGALTDEQTVLAAYYIGMALAESNSDHGAMAIVGLDAWQLGTLCPPGINVVCHRGLNSCTVSGPSEGVEAFVSKLRSGNVPAEINRCSHMGLHSQLMAKVLPNLKSCLQKLLPHSRPHSNKWVSSSMSEADWDSKAARFSSAEYLANNLLHPVLWEEASRHIPTNALTVEISPRKLLDGLDVSLCTQGVDSTESVLTVLGNLYLEGVQMNLARLYPTVALPVSRGTPMISSLVKWDHFQDWFCITKLHKEYEDSAERVTIVNINQETHKFHAGHVIDGRNLFPAAGYLVLAWETLGHLYSTEYSALDIVFEDVRFIQALHISEKATVDVTVTVQRGSGEFEVRESGTYLVTGKIRILHDVCDKMVTAEPAVPMPNADGVDMNAKDIYKELQLRGYEYKDLFRSLIYADCTGTFAQVRWHNNWVTFLDNLLQAKMLGNDTRSLFVPTAIDKLTINVSQHYDKLKTMMDDPVLPVQVYNDLDIVRSTGVEIRGLKARPIPRRKRLGEPVLERYQFVPHCAALEQPLDLHQTLRMCVHIVLENQNDNKVKTVELLDEGSNPDAELLAPELVNILGDLPLIQPDITVLARAEDPRVAEPAPGVQVENNKLESEKQTCLLVMASNIVNRPQVLQTAVGALTGTGFIIARENPTVDIASLPNLDVIVDLSVAGERILLLKKGLHTLVQNHREVVIWITENNYDWLPVLQTALKNVSPHERVVLVAQGEPFNGILGLFNCLRREPGNKTLRCFFILDPRAPRFDPSLDVYHTQLNKDLAVNVLQDGEWGSYRHLLIDNSPVIETQNAFNSIDVLGDLSSLTWFEGRRPSSDEEVVDVYYSSLNFKDLMIASGRLSKDLMIKDRVKAENAQGFEYAGRTLDGRRVMGILSDGAIANRVVLDPELTFDVPDSWSLEDAATVPVVYLTVLYAFYEAGTLEKGESILIHSGSGGVGQAAINVALSYGLTVYTTVGTNEKREFIKKQFPQLTDRHIFNSRDTSFEHDILQETNGRGVDLVLNSLSEEKLLASVRCLAHGGRFLEIGKFDIMNNNALCMEMFQKNISFYGIMLDVIWSSSSERKSLMSKLLSKSMNSGVVKPIDRTTFQFHEVEQAYRYMAAGQHIGKVLLAIRPEEPEKIVAPSVKYISARLRVYFNPKHCYIIVGGLGGFGLELADWLVVRGARKLFLVSRTGIRNGYQSSRVRTWRSYGTTVRVSQADISTADGVTTLLSEANTLGPVGGIFNLAVVLHDALLENQTEEKFLELAKTKALATRHLDVVSRRMCPELQHFVVFSSVSCGRGNAGQTNYGMANSVMERVCEARVRDGLPGVAVQWGAVGDVGLVADMQEDNRELVIGGTLQQRIGSCIKLLDNFLRQQHPVVASMVVAVKRAGGKLGSILESVVSILGIRDTKTVSPGATLAELGMDSMTGVEIKQMLEREYEVFLVPQEIRDLTIARLHELDASLKEKDEKKAGQEPPLINTTVEKHQERLNLFINSIGDQSLDMPIELPLPSLGGDGLTFLLPGVDGRGTFLKPLAAGLGGEVLVLQLGYNFTGHTVQDMVNFLLPLVKSRLSPGEPFRLVGYSFGGLLALEMAMVLEADGHRGRLVLVDSSPDFLREGTETIMPPDDVSILLHVLNLMMPLPKDINDMLKLELQELPSMDERIDFLLKKYPVEQFSPEFVIATLTSIEVRLKATIEHKWTHLQPLISPVLLLRPTEAFIPMDDEYNLPKYCQNFETRPFISGTHATIIDNPDTAVHINQFLNRH